MAVYCSFLTSCTIPKWWPSSAILLCSASPSSARTAADTQLFCSKLAWCWYILYRHDWTTECSVSPGMWQVSDDFKNGREKLKPGEGRGGGEVRLSLQYDAAIMSLIASDMRPTTWRGGGGGGGGEGEGWDKKRNRIIWEQSLVTAIKLPYFIY